MNWRTWWLQIVVPFIVLPLLAATAIGVTAFCIAPAGADGDFEAPAQSDLAGMFQDALAQWGVGGMQVDIAYEHMQMASAISYPSYDWTSCHVRVDPRTMTARTLLHEAGHCAGYHRPGEAPVTAFAGHSTDPASVMYPWNEPGQTIQQADRDVVRASRAYYVPSTYFITVGGLAR